MVSCSIYLYFSYFNYIYNNYDDDNCNFVLFYKYILLFYVFFNYIGGCLESHCYEPSKM